MAASVPVFAARGLTKVYHMGEVDGHALRGVDLDLFVTFHLSPQRPRTRPGTVVPILN